MYIVTDVAKQSSVIDHLDPKLQHVINSLPRESGVYLLKNRSGNVIYVGKAKNLRSRVRSYFTKSGDTRAFVGLLSRLLGSIETIVTHNEKEALLLENTLIKQHKPRFNVMLRDDKNYLVLRLDPKKEFPRVEVTRKIRDDSARYFGPYHSASSCRQTLRIVNRYFKLRTCTDQTLKSRTRPCLQYQIGRCPAPCVFDIDKDEYARQVDDVSLFLRGREEELVDNLQTRMQAAAKSLNFEHAANVRDQIAAVQRTLQKQQVINADFCDQDVFGFYREATSIAIVVLNIRRGKLNGQRPFVFTKQEFPDQEILSSFINLYYDRGEFIPQQVLLSTELEDSMAKQQWFTESAGHAVSVLVPQRGEKRKLVELANRNAAHHFAMHHHHNVQIEDVLEKLQKRLKLHSLPRHIECFDVSQLMGSHVVASMVVMRNGEPDQSSYRHFSIKGASDDFSAMYETMSRRLRRAHEANTSWTLPDLIVIDGGKGQLASALAALRDVGVPPGQPAPSVVALAKERHTPDAKGDDRPERVFLPQVKDPIRLRPNTQEIYLLARIRDEAHRFAITHHRKLRKRRTLRSGLDDIPSIGPRRRTQLLRSFGSLKDIRAASVEQLASVPGMTVKAAESVVRYFAGNSQQATPSSTTRTTMKKHSILIVGGQGQLGHALVDTTSAEYDVLVPDHKTLDITKPEQVETLIAKIQPSYAINAAAFTDVDRCEIEQEAARAINRDGVENLAKACSRHGVRLIQISTDYVFRGDKGQAYEEDDRPDPINVYGKTKLGGEQAAQHAHADVLIVRTAGLFGQHPCRGKPRGRNFVQTMLDLGSRGDAVRVVNDQWSCPTYVDDLASYVLHLIDETAPAGIYHAVNQPGCSWFDFAALIFDLAKIEVNLQPISYTSYQTRANRPIDSRLAMAGQAGSAAQREMATLEDALSRYLKARGRP